MPLQSKCTKAVLFTQRPAEDNKYGSKYFALCNTTVMLHLPKVVRLSRKTLIKEAADMLTFSP